MLIGQRVEDIAQFSGQTFTMSFWARGVNPTGAGSLQLRFSHSFGTGGSPSSGFSVFLTDVTLTTSWTKYVRTVTVPSMSGKVFGDDDNSYVSIELLQGGADTSTNAWHIDLAQVQLELGSVATEFEHRSYGEELALCQRYGWNPAIIAGARVGLGQCITTVVADIHVTHPVPMRASPSATVLDTTGANITGSAGAFINSTNIVLQSSTPNTTRFRVNVSGGLDVGEVTMMTFDNTDDAFIDAEL